MFRNLITNVISRWHFLRIKLLLLLLCYRGTTLRRIFWKVNLNYEWNIVMFSYLFNFKFHLHEKFACYILWAGQTSLFFLSIFFFQHHIKIGYVELRIIKGNLDKNTVYNKFLAALEWLLEKHPFIIYDYLSKICYIGS